MATPTALFDACVLYSAPLRDFLVRLAITGVCSACWSEAIHEEWMRHVLANRSDVSPSKSRDSEYYPASISSASCAGSSKFIADSFSRRHSLLWDTKD